MNKKKFNYFNFIFTILFLIFCGYYISFESGYYEASVSRKSKITQEKIVEFEKDVKEGKDIDIKEYMQSDYIDYSSPVSRVGTSISKAFDTFMSNGFVDFFSSISKLFT